GGAEDRARQAVWQHSGGTAPGHPGSEDTAAIAAATSVEQAFQQDLLGRARPASSIGSASIPGTRPIASADQPGFEGAGKSGIIAVPSPVQHSPNPSDRLRQDPKET